MSTIAIIIIIWVIIGVTSTIYTVCYHKKFKEIITDSMLPAIIICGAVLGLIAIIFPILTHTKGSDFYKD